jgi:hypothetical protein
MVYISRSRVFPLKAVDQRGGGGPDRRIQLPCVVLPTTNTACTCGQSTTTNALHPGALKIFSLSGVRDLKPAPTASPAMVQPRAAEILKAGAEVARAMYVSSAIW